MSVRRSLIRRSLSLLSPANKPPLNTLFPSASPIRHHVPSSARYIAGQTGVQAHELPPSLDNGSSSHQAYPLSGYYSDILSSSPYRRQAPTARSVSETPQSDKTSSATTSTTTSPEQTPQERMAIVFGTRLAGPGRSSRYNPGTSPEATWKTINGVPIPPRPEEPDNCCMSGCVHCVWDDFRDEMEDWAARVAQAKVRAASSGPQAEMRHAPRAEVASASTSMDDDGGGSETNWPIGGQVDDDLFANIPVGIREFMKTEKRLKKKHLEEEGAV
ncbi:oxidoreductase-like protein [Aspergillus terreus]|uniref:Oxidoreductase-like protein n=1 Tax=Aspergillus terreus TaxID=33178 RepID=A0A5M3YVI9_ASPTE|nr:hypothetical protein ATETN484_0004084200 [Aspergillus terreus]GFF13910.1 oxidoreductase-like protein [Aspergillus terreus]